MFWHSSGCILVMWLNLLHLCLFIGTLWELVSMMTCPAHEKCKINSKFGLTWQVIGSYLVFMFYM